MRTHYTRDTISALAAAIAENNSVEEEKAAYQIEDALGWLNDISRDIDDLDAIITATRRGDVIPVSVLYELKNEIKRKGANAADVLRKARTKL